MNGKYWLAAAMERSAAGGGIFSPANSAHRGPWNFGAIRRRLVFFPIVVLALALALLTGCASVETSAYRTIGVSGHAVDAAMNGWGDFVRAGKATPADEARVKAAYERYQSAMRVARAAVVSYKSTPDKPALDRALDATDAALVALLELLHLLNK